MGIIIGSSWVYNKSFWRGLPEETRAILMEQMILSLARMEIGYEQQGNEGLHGGRMEGVEVGAPEADLAAALDSYNTSFLQDLPANAAERFRIDPPDACWPSSWRSRKLGRPAWPRWISWTRMPSSPF
ncbi:hypothetical protein [Sulfitobacter sp. DFL-23]|uniref:hypothetical protein n=1 Tax=Pseudosulfitobacter pseudonitzschiae TaxID=1402135 RepID=UPI000DF3A1D7